MAICKEISTEAGEKRKEGGMKEMRDGYSPWSEGEGTKREDFLKGGVEWGERAENKWVFSETLFDFAESEVDWVDGCMYWEALVFALRTRFG
jgi:hypothetical protein